MTGVFIPGPDDADPEAEAVMHQGKAGNELYDPWFESADQASAWQYTASEDGEG